MSKQYGQDEISNLIDKAVLGNRQALEILLMGVHDLIFNMSLRMLGTIPDAEDATQEIMLRIMTNLATFRKESAFSTWAFRIASNHLKDYRKNIFSKYPLSFEYYGSDILEGKAKDVEDMSKSIEESILSQELKLSCTNVMLQCLDVESRCIFILGTMFKIDSRVAGDILGIKSSTYRQRLSRVKKKMAAFLDTYCELSGKGFCRCGNRVQYAIENRRIDPANLEYSYLKESQESLLFDCKKAMEEIDDIALTFAELPAYKATDKAKAFLLDFLQSESYTTIRNAPTH
jgi:RNA polymerase sigma factor (sigma-70 family)